MDCLIPALVALVVLGPGALAPADVGVLEGVQSRRVRYGWGLDEIADAETILIAVENCEYLGAQGVAIIEGGEIYDVAVVDCQRRDERPRLSELGIVADFAPYQNKFAHQQAVIVLW